LIFTPFPAPTRALQRIKQPTETSRALRIAGITSGDPVVARPGADDKAARAGNVTGAALWLTTEAFGRSLTGGAFVAWHCCVSKVFVTV
jgi:hypothetical protein